MGQNFLWKISLNFREIFQEKNFYEIFSFPALIKNIYEGGIIAPGINLSLRSLSEFTAKLPLIKISYQKNVIGKNTKSAINSGVFIGYSCLINGIIEKIIKQTKKKYLVVLTGGYSKIFKKNINYKTVINKNITLHGLAITVKENKKIFNEFR